MTLRCVACGLDAKNEHVHAPDGDYIPCHGKCVNSPMFDVWAREPKVYVDLLDVVPTEFEGH